VVGRAGGTKKGGTIDNNCRKEEKCDRAHKKEKEGETRMRKIQGEVVRRMIKEQMDLS